jgi:regulator of protease activity HflC (stomatin/prohibitin superfamily)
MSPLTVFLLVFGLVTVITLLIAVKVVPTESALVVERLGHHPRMLTAGVHVLRPFMEHVRATVDLREQIARLAAQRAITSDNAAVLIEAAVMYKVTDPVKLVYGVGNVEEAIQQVAGSSMRDVIGARTGDEAMTSREALVTQAKATLAPHADQWGVEITNLEITSIERDYRG